MNPRGAETQRKELSDDLNRISGKVVDAAFRVHSSLGRGLLESVYEACLVHALSQSGLKVERQVSLPIDFEGLQIESGLRLDLLVEDQVIVELKAVEQILPVHKAQILSYLRIATKPLGLLINFHVPLIKDGIFRFLP